MEIIKYGHWQPTLLCKYCGADVSLVDIDMHICPNCDYEAKETESIASIGFKRFCYTWNPKWWKFWETPHGHWQYS